MENKKRFSILKIIICIISILLIIVSLVLNIAFSGNKVPHVLGRYIYIVDENSVNEGVTPGAALFAKEKGNENTVPGSIVLCYLEGAKGLQLRGIGDVITTEDGQTKYATNIGAAPELDANGDRVTITSDRIAAVCSGNPQSLELGKYIKFSTNIKGILLQLILPCIILVVFLIVRIASSSDSNETESYEFYEYDEDEAEAEASQIPSHERQNGPLFEPSQEIHPSGDFERKKMSIAENFSQKEVDHNSSYQKEKERTMQFKAQRSSGLESPSANYRARHQSSSAESSFAARNMGGQSSTAPTADALREEMLRKTAEAERSASYNTKLYGSDHARESASDITGVLSKSQVAEMSRPELPKTAPLRTRTAPAAPIRKSSSPDINDILSKSETNAKKKNADMSVDDLLRIIENEKKKL